MAAGRSISVPFGLPAKEISPDIFFAVRRTVTPSPSWKGLLCAFSRAPETSVSMHGSVSSLAPDALPDFGSVWMEQTPRGFGGTFGIPRRPFHRRGAAPQARNIFHAVNVRAQIMVVDAALPLSSGLPRTLLFSPRHRDNRTSSHQN